MSFRDQVKKALSAQYFIYLDTWQHMFGTTSEDAGHAHKFQTNLNGSGITMPAEGHYHIIEDGRIVQTIGNVDMAHSHKLNFQDVKLEEPDY